MSSNIESGFRLRDPDLGKSEKLRIKGIDILPLLSSLIEYSNSTPNTESQSRIVKINNDGTDILSFV